MNDKIKQDNDTRLQDNETCVTEHIPQVSVCMPMYNASKLWISNMYPYRRLPYPDTNNLIRNESTKSHHFSLRMLFERKCTKILGNGSNSR